LLSATARSAAFFARHAITRKKKTARASEQDRPDFLKRRQAWFESQLDLDPERLVFIDETWASTNMARTHGRCRRGERLRVGVPRRFSQRASRRKRLPTLRQGLMDYPEIGSWSLLFWIGRERPVGPGVRTGYADRRLPGMACPRRGGRQEQRPAGDGLAMQVRIGETNEDVPLVVKERERAAGRQRCVVKPPQPHWFFSSSKDVFVIPRSR
jgi:hypothetical protein